LFQGHLGRRQKEGGHKVSEGAKRNASRSYITPFKRARPVMKKKKSAGVGRPFA